MTARKSKTPTFGDRLAALAASEKGPYLIGGLLAALLACLTLWGSREWTTRTQTAELRESIQESEAKLVSETAKAERLEVRNRELVSKYEAASRSASILRKGKTTRDAEGNESSEWEERSDFLEQLVTESQTERDQALSRAETAESRLREEHSANAVLRSELVTLKQEQVTHGGVLPSLGLGWDLGGAKVAEDRLRVGLGAAIGPWTAGLDVTPRRIVQDGPYDWSLLAPSLQADWRFGGR